MESVLQHYIIPFSLPKLSQFYYKASWAQEDSLVQNWMAMSSKDIHTNGDILIPQEDIPDFGQYAV